MSLIHVVSLWQPHLIARTQISPIQSAPKTTEKSIVCTGALSTDMESLAWCTYVQIAEVEDPSPRG